MVNPGKRAAFDRKKAEARRAKLEEKSKQGEELLDAWFEKYDVDRSGNFDRAQFKNLLTEVKRETLNDPAAEVRKELLDEIIMLYDYSNDNCIERSEVLNAVKKYKFLLQNDDQMHELIQRHDVEQSGVIGRRQSFVILQELAQKMPQKDVNEADVAYVMDRCKPDENGNISVDQLGPAIASWKETAKELDPDAPEKRRISMSIYPAASASRSCVLL